MTRSIAILLFAILTIIAMVHAYWALGGLWPGTTIQELVDTVVGQPGMQSMPRTDTIWIVSGLIQIAALLALIAGGENSIFPSWFVRLSTLILTLVFLGRGVAGYIIPLAGAELSEPFAHLNAWLYSPLCLLIGTGFLILTIKPRR